MSGVPKRLDGHGQVLQVLPGNNEVDRDAKVEIDGNKNCQSTKFDLYVYLR